MCYLCVARPHLHLSSPHVHARARTRAKENNLLCFNIFPQFILHSEYTFFCPCLFLPILVVFREYYPALLVSSLFFASDWHLPKDVFRSGAVLQTCEYENFAVPSQSFWLSLTKCICNFQCHLYLSPCRRILCLVLRVCARENMRCVFSKSGYKLCFCDFEIVHKYLCLFTGRNNCILLSPITSCKLLAHTTHTSTLANIDDDIDFAVVAHATARQQWPEWVSCTNFNSIFTTEFL